MPQEIIEKEQIRNPPWVSCFPRWTGTKATQRVFFPQNSFLVPQVVDFDYVSGEFRSPLSLRY